MNTTINQSFRYPILVNKKLGFIDYQGNEVIPPIHTRPPGANGLTGFYDDVAWVFKNEKYTLIDLQGQELFQCDFDNVDTYSNGLAKAQTHSGMGKGLKTYNGKHRGLINKQGQFVIEPAYDNIFDWHRDFIFVIKNGLWGTIDKSGKTIIPPTYRNLATVTTANHDVLFLTATNQDKKLALLTPHGKPLTGFIYDEIGLSMTDNRLVFKKKKLYGFLDQNLREIIPAQYTQAYEFAEGLARVVNHGRYGCINTQGELVIYTYTILYGFAEGLAAVKEPGESFGYIDTNNRYVIDPIYDEALWFGDGIAKVKFNGQEGFIDHHQKNIIPFDKYEFLQKENNLIRFKLNRKYGFYGTDGRLLISPEFKNAESPENGLIKVEDGYLNYQGDLVWMQPTIAEPDFSFSVFMGGDNGTAWIKQEAIKKSPHYAFGATLTENQIVKIEEQYKIKLPKDYREFIMHVGDGGPGPMDGLDNLTQACERSYQLNEAFVPSELSDDENDFFDKPGILLIASDNVVYTFGLVTSGPDYGTIWFSDSRYWFPYTPVFWQAVEYYDDYNTGADYIVKNQLKIPRMRFNDWYYQWLKH